MSESDPAPTTEPVTPFDPEAAERNTFGYYIRPFFMYLLLIIYVVIGLGLWMQNYSHQDNAVSKWFWSFLHVVDEVVSVWIESNPE